MKSKVKHILLLLTKMKLQSKLKLIGRDFIFVNLFFSRKVQIQTDEIEAYLKNIPLPNLTNEHTLNCENIISDDDVLKSLKSMENNKSPGNDGLSKEFC